MTPEERKPVADILIALGVITEMEAFQNASPEQFALLCAARMEKMHK